MASAGPGSTLRRHSDTTSISGPGVNYLGKVGPILKNSELPDGENYLLIADGSPQHAQFVDNTKHPENPFAVVMAVTSHLRPGDPIPKGGIEVRLVESGLDSFIKRSDLSRDRDEQRPERFTVGQKVDARVLTYDKKTRKVTVSIKALEIAEEKEAVAQYGSTDSGASLGDILGAALKNRKD